MIHYSSIFISFLTIKIITIITIFKELVRNKRVHLLCDSQKRVLGMYKNTWQNKRKINSLADSVPLLLYMNFSNDITCMYFTSV